MSRDLADLTPDTRSAVTRLLSFAKSRGLVPRIDYTRRTCAEQAAIYEQGRSTPGSIVTNAQGCGSYHVLGRAIDINIGSERCKDYEELGRFWESIGGVWGGRFALDDCVHFEWPHPTLGLRELCPPGISCEAAVRLQPPAFSPLFAAGLGLVVGATIVGIVTR
jgi:peptidoglycan L-alanyl-D-glutamate endopeptidase CwlK